VKHSQWGSGLVGVLIALAMAALIGYYAFIGVWGGDEVPTCKAELSACLKECRRTTTEAPEAQRCQEACQREAEECERGSG
jgi:hypothetical protein